MQRLDHITLTSPHGPRVIELLRGDLTAIPDEHAVDVLVVSAFPDNYAPTRASLIGGLYHNRGLSVAALAANKAEDLRNDFGCWLSQPVPDELGFSRLLCFEPRRRGRPSDVVGDLFRAFAALSGTTIATRTAAMPLIAAGHQGYQRNLMLRQILSAAREWMNGELPLTTLKIVVYQDVPGPLLETFAEFKKKLEGLTSIPPRGAQCDVFMSAVPADLEAAQILVEVMSTVCPDLEIYRPEPRPSSIETMLQQHHELLHSCRRVVVLLTPDYLASKVRQSELCVARFRSHNSPLPVLFPIYLRDAVLPPSIRILRMVDCRERDLSAIRVAAALLAIQLRGIRAFGDSALENPTTRTWIDMEHLGNLLGVPVLGTSRRHDDVGPPGKRLARVCAPGAVHVHLQRRGAANVSETSTPWAVACRWPAVAGHDPAQHLL